MSERKNLFNDETQNEPLTIQGLRTRLKHIASLCWGLSIDLNNEIERNELLVQENKELRRKLCCYSKDSTKRYMALSKLPPEEREKREEELLKQRLKMRKSRRRKAVETYNDNIDD